MDKIWLDHYDKGIPQQIDPACYTSLNQLFSEAFQKYNDRISFTSMGSHLRFDELEQRSRYFATYLQQLKLAKGARVAIMLPNLLQYPIVLLGILRAGLVVVNTNPLYTADEVVHQLHDAKAQAVIGLAQFGHVIEQALPKIPSLKHVILTEIGDGFAMFKRYVINAVVKYIKHRSPAFYLPQAKKFLDVLHQGSQGKFKTVACQLDDIAFLQYTGGTTGISKGAMLTHGNMIANVLQTAAWISPKNIGKDPSETIITALPLYHVFSLMANCLLFLHLGVQNILITDPRDTKKLLKQIHATPPTAMTGVNTLFASLINHSKFDPTDFFHTKIVLSGGMALHQSIAEKWKMLTHHPIIEAYGLTEASPAVCINPLIQHPHPESIGLPLPSTEISIRNEQGEECPIDEVGELCVRGPQVMQGYWQHPEETALVFWPDGFLRTGDSARINASGFVYLIDRIKDLIIVSGFNVYPNEVEQVIAQMPQVQEVAVIGVMSKSGNERIKACIVTRDPNLSAEDVIAFCRKHLTTYKIPKIIEFYPTLPKTNVGKILRRMLK